MKLHCEQLESRDQPSLAIVGYHPGVFTVAVTPTAPSEIPSLTLWKDIYGELMVSPNGFAPSWMFNTNFAEVDVTIPANGTVFVDPSLAGVLVRCNGISVTASPVSLPVPPMVPSVQITATAGQPFSIPLDGTQPLVTIAVPPVAQFGPAPVPPPPAAVVPVAKHHKAEPVEPLHHGKKVRHG